MPDISVFIGGQAGEGIKRGAMVIGKAFNRFGYHIFIMNDYGSIIRGGQDYSEVRISSVETGSQAGFADFFFAYHKDVYERYLNRVKEEGVTFLEGAGVNQIPYERILKENNAKPFMRSSIVLGVLSYMTKLPFEIVEEVMINEFKDKAYTNIELARKGFQYVRENHFPIRPIPEGDKMPLPIMYGNDAIALGGVKVGMKVYAAYPITPTSTLLDFLAMNAKRLGISVIHAEDEIAAIMMGIGASYASAPVMVGSSGPGIDLMGEAISLSGGAEVPIVIVDVQRGGPTTGMPTYTEQSDLFLSLSIGHGEFPRIVLAPGSVEEAFEMTIRAFQYAYWYQTPVIVLSDKHLSESAKSVSIPFSEEYVLPLKYFEGGGDYKRYKLTDDGISPLAFPGMEGIVNHTNSTEHMEDGYSTAIPESVKLMKDKRIRKQETIREDFMYEENTHFYGNADNGNLIIASGSTKGAIMESIQGLPVNFLQILTLEPFPVESVKEIMSRARNVIVVEENSTGQLADIIRSRTGVEISKRILKYDGRPFDPVVLRKDIEEVIG